MDSLSDVLAQFRVSSTVFSRAELRAPWAVHTSGLNRGIFHAVVRGRGWLALEGAQEQAVPFSTGDVVVLPHGHAHVMSSDPALPPVPITELIETGDSNVDVLRVDGGGMRTELVCGSIEFAHATGHPLLSQLPHFMHVRAEDATLGGWLSEIVRLLSEEVTHDRPGASTLTARLADVVVVQALRAYIASLPPGEGGWLGALNDPDIRRALALLHSHPQETWTTKTLAHKVGMSRSSLYARFSALVGDPPGRYLTRWRIHLAARALREEKLTVGEAALRVGYESEASFSKAFKTLLGQSPGAWRKAANY